MLELDILAAADAPEDGEQVQADEHGNDQDAMSGEGEDDPPPDAGLPEGQNEDVANGQDEPDRPGDVRLSQFISPPHSYPSPRSPIAITSAQTSSSVTRIRNR